jgi:predicted kinase
MGNPLTGAAVAPSKLIVFAGLPGAGKSALAEAAGKRLNIPVFAKDRVEAALWRSGIGRELNSGWVSYDLLTALAESQLRLGQSAILDSVATFEKIRRQWRALAAHYGADFRVIECICSDEALHRARLKRRRRDIPGWHELDWAEVEAVRERYESWVGEWLVVDAVEPMDSNARLVMEYINKS